MKTETVYEPEYPRRYARVPTTVTQHLRRTIHGGVTFIPRHLRSLRRGRAQRLASRQHFMITVGSQRLPDRYVRQAPPIPGIEEPEVPEGAY